MDLCFKHQTFIRFPLCALCYFRSYGDYRSEEAVPAFMTVFGVCSEKNIQSTTLGICEDQKVRLEGSRGLGWALEGPTVQAVSM